MSAPRFTLTPDSSSRHEDSPWEFIVGADVNNVSRLTVSPLGEANGFTLTCYLDDPEGSDALVISIVPDDPYVGLDATVDRKPG